ncbi:MAG: hypothetical protein GQ570_10360 [Helicobacteraceae bacterium]|nr:hypothetical protein [Helicobacteraceae bacterium]
MPEAKKVTIRALKPLRGEDGKKVAVGSTTEVSQSTSEILIKHKHAELVTK